VANMSWRICTRYVFVVCFDVFVALLTGSVILHPERPT